MLHLNSIQSATLLAAVQSVIPMAVAVDHLFGGVTDQHGNTLHVLEITDTAPDNVTYRLDYNRMMFDLTFYQQ